jgi:hypothetical protein
MKMIGSSLFAAASALKIKTTLPRRHDAENPTGGAIRQVGLEKVGN